MTMGEALNRGFNLLATASVAVSCFAFVPAFFRASSPYGVLDDILLFVLGIFLLWWYNHHTNKFKRSLVPIVAAASALGIKVFGFILHEGEGLYPVDSIGGLLLFCMLTCVIGYQYFRTQALIESFIF